MTVGRNDDNLVAAISEAARRDAEADVAGGPPLAAWHRLQAVRERRSGLRRHWRLAAAGAAGLALTLVVWAVQRPRPLTYLVAGKAAESNGYVRGADSAETELAFSDGTRVRLARAARMSVVAATPRGARLRVEDGRAHFEVSHRSGADWSVEAGPYRVQVTGTVFDVRWSGAEGAATVWLHEGAVRVRGPHLTGDVALAAGQRLEARVADGVVRIEARARELVPGSEAPTSAPHSGTGLRDDLPPLTPTHEIRSPVASPPVRPATAHRKPAVRFAPDSRPVRVAAGESAAVPAAGPDREAATSALPSGGRLPAEIPPLTPAHEVQPPSVRPATARRGQEVRFDPDRWPARVAAGESAAVLSEARAHSLEAVVSSADERILAALADAARYTHEQAIAEHVLVVLRRRFPSSAQAHAAAFLLGRSIDDGGDAETALRWYQRYLAEAPHGPYSAEALGREMLAVERLSGRPAAAELARAYIARFPDGTYILQARAILGLP